MRYTLGSLFDGSGGFPLAGSLCGVTPVWASEVEPYPIAVTRSRFPFMKHLGDIRKVNGGDIEPVDIITFGSPCQDLSVAGKRAGLKHEANGGEETTRSGLFMEAVRIIREMREETNGFNPRFALWENVPGAFSSNKGGDFRVVLEELVKIVEPEAVMPSVPAKGWAYADSYIGDGWSLAYRVFDAQYWGVPQRRRRIHLVLDLRGECAGKVLFEREGVRGHFTEGRTPRKGSAGDAADRTGTTGFDGYNGNLTGDVSSTLGVNCGMSTGRNGIILDDQGGQQITVRTDGKANTLRAEMHGNIPCALEASGFKAGQSMAGSIGWQEECAATLASKCSGTEPTVCIKECLPFDTTQVTSTQNRSNPKFGDSCHPLTAQGHPPAVVCKCFDARGNGDGKTVNTITGDHENRITDYTSVVVEPVFCLQNSIIERNAKQGGSGIREGASFTLTTIGTHGVCYCVAHGQANAEISMNKSTCLNCNHEKPIAFSEDVRYIVRRLTLTECARLQGFPDDWGRPDTKDDFTDEEYRFWKDVRNTHSAINGKQVKEYTKKQMLTWYNKLHTDSAEHKMWGNGIALPPALYVMQGMVDAISEQLGGVIHEK